MSAEKRARELLAAEYAKVFRSAWAEMILRGDNDESPEMMALIAALTPQWQPISTAPRDGTFILAVCKGFTPAAAQWTTDFRPEGEFTFLEPGMFAAEDHWEEMLAQTDPWQPTHWLPLPAPPEGEV